MDKNYVKRKIKELRKYASDAGMQIRFKTYPDNFNTFCIFIYDRSFRKHSYAVGFDGCFDNDGDFDKCLKQAYDEIDNPYWLNPEYADCVLVFNN
jgi:hypothetical protein